MRRVHNNTSKVNFKTRSNHSFFYKQWARTTDNDNGDEKLLQPVTDDNGNLVPSKEQAEFFITALTGNLDQDQCFQVLPEKDSNEISPDVIFEKFEDGFDKLTSINNRSGLVALTINETDGQGRKRENITKLRAFFVDLDGSDLEPVKNWTHHPHMIVETSPGRFHSYWLIDDMPEGDWKDLQAVFKDVQKKLIKLFDADKVVHDLPRAMRLPGFHHQKPDKKTGDVNPFRVDIIYPETLDIQEITERIPYADFIEALDKTFGEIENSTPSTTTNVGEYSSLLKQHSFTSPTLKAALKTIKETPEGKRNDVIFKRSCNVGREVARGNIDREAAFEALINAASEYAEDDGSEAAMASINSGLDRGKDDWEKQANGLPDPFFRDDDGNIFTLHKTQQDEIPIPICSPIEFLSLVRNSDEHEWSVECEIKTRDGNWNLLVLPLTQLTKQESWLDMLTSAGLVLINDNNKKYLKDLFRNVDLPQRARYVPSTGWHGDLFVLPGTDPSSCDVFGETEERIVLQATGTLEHKFGVNGSLKEWWEHIGKKALGNSRLEFAICQAFAPPLLEPMNLEGGGFHLVGPSSIGKTTVLSVSGSVCGGPDYIRSWRSTDNAMEGTALLHNHMYLPLDEISQIVPKALSESIYMLANGQGKSRADKNGNARAVATWKLNFGSTGEVSISDKIGEDKFAAKMKGGQSVRMIDLPADAGAGMGLFEDTHGMEPGEFARSLTEAANKKYYGTPIRAFLDVLIADKDYAIEAVSKDIKAFCDEMVSKGADGQVGRVATRMGLIGAAGELAIAAEILPWPEGTAMKAAERMFTDWLEMRGTTGSFEIDQGVQSVKNFILKHGASRFQDKKDWDTTIIYNRIGFFETVKNNIDTDNSLTDKTKGSWPHDNVTSATSSNVSKTIYYIPSGNWAEVCGGNDPQGTARALADEGILQPDNHGKLTKNVRLPKIGQKRCYVLVFGVDIDNVTALPEVHKKQKIG